MSNNKIIINLDQHTHSILQGISELTNITMTAYIKEAIEQKINADETLRLNAMKYIVENQKLKDDLMINSKIDSPAEIEQTVL